MRDHFEKGFLCYGKNNLKGGDGNGKSQVVRDKKGASQFFEESKSKRSLQC